MDVSIIIINYRTPKLVIECVNSIIQKSSGFSYEIIVIDNDSKDGSNEVLKSSLGEKITLIESQANLGTANGYNLGASKAAGKYLWYLNSDTVLLNNAGLILLTYLDQHPDVADVGANLYAKDGTPCSSFEKFRPTIRLIKRSSNPLIIFYHRFFKKVLCSHFNYTDKPMQIFDPSAACMMVKTEILKKVGGWEQKIFMYGEEPLLCSLFLKEGFTSMNVPSAKLVHLEGASQGQIDSFSPNRYKRFLDGTCVSFQKMYGEDQRKPYLRARLYSEKRSYWRYFFLLQKGKAEICKAKIRILSEYLDQKS